MSHQAFNNLVNLLRKDITVDCAKSHNATSGNDPAHPEMVVACGLRFVGEKAPHAALRDICGISMSSLRHVVNLFLTAVNNCSELQIRLPKTEPDELGIAAGLLQRSQADTIFCGCLGALDGWLLTTKKPSYVPNPQDCHSGYYQRYGLNVQAMCDSRLRFAPEGFLG
jgi:hypothetical protein